MHLSMIWYIHALKLPLFVLPGTRGLVTVDDLGMLAEQGEEDFLSGSMSVLTKG